MRLKQGEGELQSGKATIKEFIIAGKDSKQLLESSEGMLYLTNRRLVMEKEAPSREPTLIFEFPLEGLQNAETKGVFGKVLHLEADLSQMNTGSEEKKPELKEGFGKFSIKVNDPKTWAGQLSRAIKSRKEER